MSLPEISLWNQVGNDYSYTTEKKIQYLILTLSHNGKRSLRVFDPHVLGWKALGHFDTTKQAYQAACEYNNTHV